MNYERPKCADCAHRNYETLGLVCEAYPRGIPSRFLQGGETHDKVESDQVGECVFQNVKR